MKINKTTKTLLAGYALVMSLSIQAKSYLTFDLGKASKQQVIAQLNKHQAKYNANYGYQGYANDLPIIKVKQFDGFNKYGQVNSAWLYFSPTQVLYKISVEYADSGKIHRVFNDSLNKKYGLQKSNGFGFTKHQYYQDKDVSIVLTRNEFGFGRDQKTTLEYLYQPLTQAVESTKVKIDQDIAQKNASKAEDL